MSRIKITNVEGTEKVLKAHLFDEIEDLKEEKVKLLEKLSSKDVEYGFIGYYSHQLEIVMEKLDVLERIADRLIDYKHVEVSE